MNTKLWSLEIVIFHDFFNYMFIVTNHHHFDLAKFCVGSVEYDLNCVIITIIIIIIVLIMHSCGLIHFLCVV